MHVIPYTLGPVALTLGRLELQGLKQVAILSLPKTDTQQHEDRKHTRESVEFPVACKRPQKKVGFEVLSLPNQVFKNSTSDSEGSAVTLSAQ